MDKIQIYEKIQNHIEELKQYANKDIDFINKSENFSNLVYEINQTINLDIQLKNHYENQITYFDKNLDKINSIIEQITNNFKHALKLINPKSLDDAKNSQCNIERVFNIILNEMSIPFSNEGKAFFTATDMINQILNYNFDLKYDYRNRNLALQFIEKLEKFDMQHLYTCINKYFEYESDKELFNQSSKELIIKLTDILVKIPQKEFIYFYLNGEAIILYFEFKNTNNLSIEKYHLSCLLTSEIKNFAVVLTKTLEQLKIVLSTQASKNNIPKDVIYKAKILNHQLFLDEEIIPFSLTEAQYLEEFLDRHYINYSDLGRRKELAKKYASNINKKIKKVIPNLKLIETVPKVGYKISDKIEYKKRRK